MYKGTVARLVLATLLLTAAHGSAGVVMCTDPVTGKKTFTDKGCPTAGSGKKVKVEPINFGQGVRADRSGGVWKSDRETAVSGRENMEDEPPLTQSEYKSGYLPSGS